MTYTADGVTVGRIAEGMDHPEGVALSPSGELWAGGLGGQIYRIDVRNGDVEERACSDGTLLGVCVDGDGFVYCCDTKRREVIRLDPTSGALDVYSNGTAARPMINPNWAAFDSIGNLYLTDSGTWQENDGWIWRIAPGGAAAVWSEESINFPNGCCLDADERNLLVLESLTPALVKIPIHDDGTAGAREVIAELPGTVPDGIALDTQGRAYICCYEPNRILRIDESGKVEVLLDDPDGESVVNPTNPAWFGAGLTRFVSAALGGEHLTEVEIPGATGLSLHYPRLAPTTVV